jgi:pyruvate, water dikinase
VFEIFKLLFTRINHSRNSLSDRFRYFQALLSANDEAHKYMSDIADILVSGNKFSKGKATTLYKGLYNSTEKIAKQLILLSTGKYRNLLQRVKELDEISHKILSPRVYCQEGWECFDIYCEECPKSSRITEIIPYDYHISEVDDTKEIEVGSKMSRLGEIRNKLGIPVPDGFSLTVRLFEEIMATNQLREHKNEIFYNVEFENINEVYQASRQAQELINSTPISDEIEEIILNAYDKYFGINQIRLAVRSSARGEDSIHHSFAGLHKSELNVSRENLPDACIEVLLSKYSPESVVYRYNTGLRDEDMPMSIACIEMVDAKAGGVLMTSDPGGGRDGIIIQAVYGLGSSVVEGKVAPQEFVVSHDEEARILSFNPGRQDTIINPLHADGITKNNIHPELARTPCLTHEQIKILVGYSLIIEEHYQSPQDIEWALDKKNVIYILQARPLKIQSIPEPINQVTDIQSVISKYDSLIDEGDCASRGIGYGKVFIAHNLREIRNLNGGEILISKKNTPELASVLHKASAILTEAGSTTGHLSILAREMGVPVITNIPNAMSLFSNGQELTVFADVAKIYSGRNEEIIQLRNIIKDQFNEFHGTPLYKIVHRLSKYIFKLNLTKPNAPNFAPEYCRTFHDVIRFAHETAMNEMFSMYESSRTLGTQTFKLKFDVPLDIRIIDLGDCLSHNNNPEVSLEQIRSKPFQALVEGMTSPGIRWGGPLGVDVKGFMNIMVTNATDSGKAERNIGSLSYALLSDNYLNFFSRLGYHFSRLDSFICDEVNSNYINFHFRGGAADSTRRNRRAQAIKQILGHFGFETIRNEDNVIAKIRKIPEEEIIHLLKEIGKLMGAVRNTDVTMVTDEHVELFVKYYLEGNPAPAEMYR